MNETIPTAPQTEDEQHRVTAQEIIEDFDDEDIDLVARDQLEFQLYRYVRIRTGLEAERDRLKAAMAAMIQNAERRIQALDFVYQPACAEVTRSLLKGKAKSVKTPYGVAGFRKKPARVVVVNEQELVSAWQLEILPREAVKHETVTTAKPVLSVLADLYEKTGEVPTGCELTPAEDVFYVKGV